MIKNTFSLLLLIAFTTANGGTNTPVPAQISPTITPERVEEISYNNIDLSYVGTWGEAGPVDLSSQGVAVGIEVSPLNHLYLALNGSWSDLEFDGPGGVSVGSDLWKFNGGAAAFISLTRNIHFVTEVGATYADFDAGVASGDGWGAYVMPHLRAKFGKFETHVGATYVSNDAALSEWTAFLRALYEVAPNLDVFVTGTIGLTNNDILDDVFGVNAGLRYKF